MTTIVRADQTCTACPSQWDAWDADGRYWYLRYRGGYGSMSRGYNVDTAPLSFDDADQWGGEISLEDFCERIGVTLTLGPTGITFEAPPPLPGEDT